MEIQFFPSVLFVSLRNMDLLIFPRFSEVEENNKERNKTEYKKNYVCKIGLRLILAVFKVLGLSCAY